MAQRKITAKQQEILDYIKEEILKKGYPPADAGEERIYPQGPD